MDKTSKLFRAAWVLFVLIQLFLVPRVNRQEAEAAVSLAQTRGGKLDSGGRTVVPSFHQAVLGTA